MELTQDIVIETIVIILGFTFIIYEIWRTIRSYFTSKKYREQLKEITKREFRNNWD